MKHSEQGSWASTNTGVLEARGDSWTYKVFNVSIHGSIFRNICHDLKEKNLSPTEPWWRSPLLTLCGVSSADTVSQILCLFNNPGRGWWGEGSIGATTIKDTRTKSRARVEVGEGGGTGWGGVEGRGENADNCN